MHEEEHAMDLERAIRDTIGMDKAVGIAKNYTDEHGDTMVIVAADNAHSVSVHGTVDYSKTSLNSVQVYENAGRPAYKDTDDDSFPDSGKDAGGDGVADQVAKAQAGQAPDRCSTKSSSFEEKAEDAQ